MKPKPTRRLTLALIFCSIQSVLFAQTDSTWLDLGRIKLKKEFTQTVTIKGKDLEQMPFARLSDAIDVWLFGLATNASTYVIDGHVLTDVNAYSIYDIEEITLVQNALVQLNGAIQTKQLLLITTRKNSDKKQGLTIAGSSFAVDNSFQSLGGDAVGGQTNFYHRYYVSAYQNRQNIQYGLSAAYLRDVNPYPDTGYNIEKPYQVNRFALNGYLNANLNAANSVWLRAGFIPAQYRFEYSEFKTSPNALQAKNKQTNITVEAGWQSRLSKHLTNELSAGYTPVKSKGESEETYFYPGTSGVLTGVEYQNSKTALNNLLISDQLAYEATIGNWSITPSVNVSYRHIKSDSTRNLMIQNSGSVISYNGASIKYKMDLWLLTPSINVSYKDWFNVQGGFLYNLSKEQPGNGDDKKLFPFVTTAINVLKLAGADSKLSWKVFGSYAHAGNFADMTFQLQDVKSSLPGTLRYGNDEKNYMIQAGTTAGIWHDRLQFSYSFDKRRYMDMGTTYVPWQQVPIFVWLNTYSTLHRFGVLARVLDKSNLSWLTGLNASSTKTLIELNYVQSVPGATIKFNPYWTGGFTNRFQYKKIIAGVDILYAFNQKTSNLSSQWGDDNSISFKNIYAGYRAQIGNKAVELFAETRNPRQRNESLLPDRRNYFGLGGKLEW